MAGELVLAPHDDLGRGRRRRGAQVGDEIGDGHVGLVADRRDHRHRRGGDGPGDGFFVERPEIFDRPAAAAGDDHVHALDAGDLPQRPGDVAGRALALHPRRRDDDVGVRIAAPQHPDDVAQRRAVERGDHADAARQCRQRPLARLIEQALGGQPGAQLLVGELQRAQPARLHVLADQLVLAARARRR